MIGTTTSSNVTVGFRLPELILFLQNVTVGFQVRRVGLGLGVTVFLQIEVELIL